MKVTTDYLLTAEGSVLIEVGNTHVLCAASIEETVPHFLRNSGKGWVTAEYSMLPRATATRTPREVSKGRASGRTMEIQRLIGRSLRSIIDLDALGERSIILDCDVLQADGGTRTAAITGAYIALSVAVRKLVKFGALKRNPIRDYVAATSVGVVGGVPMLDLCYQEDSQAEVDMNVVMTGSGKFVELQATAEKTAFDDAQLASLIALARSGIAELIAGPEDLSKPRDRLLRHSRTPASCASSSWPLRISTCARCPNPSRRPTKPATPSKPTPSRRPSHYGAASPTAIFSPTIPAWRSTRSAARPACIPRATPETDATDAANNALLARNVCAASTNRTARFVCVIALVHDGKLVQDFPRRRRRPHSSMKPRGSGGFGYDPLFYYEPFGCTFGEAPIEQKMQVSHRAQALDAMFTYLRSIAST